MNKDKKENINIKNINSSISLLNKILKISYILIVLALIYVITIIFKEWKIFNFVGIILSIVSPLFIGFAIAWLLHPIVDFLNKKKIPRVVGSLIVFISFILVLVLFISMILPILGSQLNNLISILPSIFDEIMEFVNKTFSELNSSLNLDINLYINNIKDSLLEIGKSLTNDLPGKIFSFVGSLFSGIGTIVISFMISFYLLINFNNVDNYLLNMFPKKSRHDAKLLGGSINCTLRKYVSGTLLIAFIIFVTNYIGFAIIGIESPMLFALFCAITNIIPYLGPYIGGIPVCVVGLSQGTTTGVLALLYIIAIQMLESMILQPIIMSKTMKLHPVTIIVGLLVFGYFFGIVGMIFATPIVSVLKVTFNYFDDKYDLLKYKNK